MAGSRLEKFGTIFKRTQGLIRSGALKWENRPVWYDVMEAFPPRIPPSYERETPTGDVRKILYPEDIVRAKFFETYTVPEVVTLEMKTTAMQNTKVQEFVDTYIQLQEEGKTEVELMKEVEQALRARGIQFFSKEQQKIEKSKLSVPDVIEDVPNEEVAKR